MRLADYEFDNSLVAFLDILGFKNILKSDDKNKLIKFLYEIKETNIRFHEEYVEDPNGDAHSKIQPYIISFSDHIILSLPDNLKHLETCDNPWIKFAGRLLCMGHYIEELQLKALAQGFALRGAISLGKIFFDYEKSIIVGDPLVEAIEAENSLAIYPRVILTESVVSASKKIDCSMITPSEPPYTYCEKDFDGLYYVSYLPKLAQRAGIPKYLAELNLIRTNILDNIEKNTFKASSKWSWLGNYFNNTIQKLHLTTVEKIKNLS